MLKLSTDFSDKLRDILLGIPALEERDNRTQLLRGLPRGPVSAINRSNALMADINNIIDSAEGWGQLADSGEWALVIVARNALRFSKGVEHGAKIEALLSELETLPSDKDLPAIPEVVIGQDERLSIHFLEKGLIASKSVAKVIIPRVVNGIPQDGKVSGTGWLITPDILITNYHVIEARDRQNEPAATKDDFKAQALKTSVWFGYTEQGGEYTDYNCTELLHYSTELDYALLRIQSEPISKSGEDLSKWGYLSIPKLYPTLIKGNRLNIIQHPKGFAKQIAIRNNFYVDNISNRIRYLTDTEPGSSGSPVFNDDWQIVALHHAAVEVPETQYKGEVVKYNNQGILIHPIIENFPENIQKEIQNAQNW